MYAYVSKHIRISIIIPAYNEERYLGRCLDAIAAQTMQPYEVIVVDNASTDGTAAVARAYPFVTLVTELHKGRVFAREVGFAAAKGTVLARIDADSVVPRDWIAQLHAYFVQPGALATAWTGNGRFCNVRMPRSVSWLYNLLAFRFNALVGGHPTLWGSNMAVPRALWQQVRSDLCLRNDIHEDLDIAIHLHRAGVAITYNPHMYVIAHMRRVRSNRAELWEYLQMWPQTLRVHGRRTWVVCWLVGSVTLFALTPFLGVAEQLARLCGRKPLRDD